jgi:metal-responsive CopG/Arc/MetJ family transcriptional regulator
MFENARKLPWMFVGARRSRTKRFTLTVPEEMANRLDEERKRRLLDSVPETVRAVLSDYFSNHKGNGITLRVP